jgi:hypothetical protein
MNYNGLNVLIIGGAGFIGSHLCESLLVSGCQKVFSLDNYSSGKEDNHVDNVTYIRGHSKNNLNSLYKNNLERERVCQARFGFSNYSTSIGFQRKLCLEKIESSEFFLTGFTSPKLFLKEMSKSIAVLSPFGWGEICYRDAEAFRLGSVVLKPCMKHLESWPNLYMDNETYIPFDWAANDLIYKCDDVINDLKKSKYISSNALDRLSDCVKDVDSRVQNY